MAKTTIPTKSIGSKLTSGEFNQLNAVVNFNADFQNASYDSTELTTGDTLPVHDTPAWLFAGIGTFIKPEGGTIVTTQPFNIIATDGSVYSLILESAIVLTDYATKQNIVDILSLKVANTFPADRSAITFSTANLNPGVYYYEDQHLLLAGETMRTLKITATANGTARLAFLKLVGSVASVLYTVQTPVVTGINNIDIASLNIPAAVIAQDRYLAITAVVSGALKYNTSVGALGHITTSLTGGNVSNAAAIFPHWFVKNYVLDNYPTTKATLDKVVNMTGDPVVNTVPFSKSALSISNSTPVNTWFGDDLTRFNGNDFVSLTFKSRFIGGVIRIAFVDVSGGIATFRYTSQSINVTAINDIEILKADLVGLPDLSAYNNMVAFIINDNASFLSVCYHGETAGNGYKYYSINPSTGVMTTTPQSTSVVNMLYSIKVNATAYPAIVSTVKGLSGSSNYQQLVDAISNQSEIRLHGNITLDGTLTIPADKKIIGDGSAKLTLGAGVTKGIYLGGADRTILEGFTISGGTLAQLDITGTTVLPLATDLSTLTGRGTKQGIHIYNSDGVIVDKVHFENLDAEGLILELLGANGVAPYGFIKGVDVSNCFANNCYIGYRTMNSGEYSRFTGVKANHCIAGIHITSGNITVANSGFEQNRVGAYVGAGTNNAHGSFIGGTMNHNKLRGLMVQGITNGQVFSGVNNFDGHIEINDSVGVIISGGLIASEITAVMNVNQAAFITSNIWRSDGGYNTGTINKSGAGKLILSNNEFSTGKSNTTINVIL